jgi:hypothetical protein
LNVRNAGTYLIAPKDEKQKKEKKKKRKKKR